MKGYERREGTQDPNAKAQGVQALQTPLAGVMRPSSSNFSAVGEEERKLAQAIGGVSVGIEKYVQKKMPEWELQGKMARAEGQTEAEVSASGNRYTTAGWQAMNGQIAGNELYQTELNHISTTGKTMNSKDYQTYLSDRLKKVTSELPASSSSTKAFIHAQALETYPKLVAEQIKQNNEFNRTQTLESGRKMLFTTSETKSPEETAMLLDRGNYPNMSPEDYNKMVKDAAKDSYTPGVGTGKLGDLLTKVSKPIPMDPKNLMDTVGGAESNNNYNAVYNGENPRLSSMSLDEVMKLQHLTVFAGGKSSAMGKYQIVNETLQGLKDELKLTGSEKFDNTLQDRMAVVLLKRRGLDDFNAGKITAEKFQYNLAQEWAALPMDKSGLSYYHKDGINKATIQPGQIGLALAGDASAAGLHGFMNDVNMSSDDRNDLLKAKDSYEKEQSAKFDASRLMTEKGIEQAAVNLNDEDLFKQIQTAKEAGGYSDAWGNSLWNSAQAKKTEARKEQDKVTKVKSLMSTNSVALGSKEEQQKAIDLVTKQALAANPDAVDPSSPNNMQAKQAAQDQMYKFMYANQITDDRLKSQWEAATVGDIIDKSGRVKEPAKIAYDAYLQARSSTSDPIWAQSLLSDKTKDIFLMADSYLDQSNSNTEQALASASAFVQEQNTMKGVNNLPWWKDYKQSKEVTDQLVSNTLPGVLKLYGIGDTQAQMAWSINTESVEAAAKSPDVVNRVKMEASKLWHSTSKWDDQDAAKNLALAKATGRVAQKSEYIAGSFVYTGDQPSIASKIGMGNVKNAANMVTSRIMAELGPEIWDNFNSTDFYTMSQTWHESEPGVEKVFNWVKEAATQIPSVVEKTQQKVRGIPDFAATLNPTGNALILAPYTDFDRTRQGSPFILPIEQMKIAADLITRKDEAGFKKWVQEQKPRLPKYKQ